MQTKLTAVNKIISFTDRIDSSRKKIIHINFYWGICYNTNVFI